MKVLKLSIFGILLFFILTSGICTNEPPETNENPVAIINSTPNALNGVISGFGPLSVVFDASASYDPDDCADCQIVKYEWDLNNDDVYEVTDEITIAKTFAARDSDYVVTLRVTDNYEQIDEAVLTVKSKFSPVTPYVNGYIYDNEENPIEGIAVMAIPDYVDDLYEYFLEEEYTYSYITNENGKYFLENLEVGITFYINAGILNNSDNWIVPSTIDTFHLGMEYDDLAEQINFPEITPDTYTWKDTIDITMQKGINLLNDGDEWGIDPVEISDPFTFEWEYENHPPVSGYVVYIINENDEVVWEYPEFSGDEIPTLLYDTQIECPVLDPGEYNLVVGGILFEIDIDGSGSGEIVMSEPLEGRFEYVESE